ncbi:MAG: nuclease A inhibitor family protein [Spirosomataceae bacterium]
MNVDAQLKAWVEDLYFITETDEPWEMMYLSPESCDVSYWIARGYQEIDWALFWKPLTEEQDWYEEVEKTQAERYRTWVVGLEENSAEWFVVRKGDIQKEWMVVFQLLNGQVIGCRTQGIET